MKIKLVQSSEIDGLEGLIRSCLQSIENEKRKASLRICENIKQIGAYLERARNEFKADRDFGRWCKEKFGWSQPYTYRMREAGRVAAALLDGVNDRTSHAQKPKLGMTALPASERQLRVLAEYSDDNQQIVEAWSAIEKDVPRNSEGEVKSATAIKKALIEHEFIDPPTPREKKEKQKPSKAAPPASKENFDPTTVLAGLSKKQALALAKAAELYAKSL